MSVYKPSNSPYYHIDFVWRGHRVHKTTGATSRREAEALEKVEKEQAKKRVADQKSATVSLALDHLVDRYWNEVGQHHAGANDAFRYLGRLVEYFGKDKLLTEITDADVARFVAHRRGHKNQHTQAPITSFTVNHTTTELLRKLFTYAKNRNARFVHEPRWRNHLLKEPEERVRELIGDEGDRLDAVTREDYKPFFEFVAASGLRKNECIFLRWSEVNWAAKQIIKFGKGGRRITCPITPTIRAILEPLQGHHSEFVFTFVAAYTRGEHIQGRRYPLTLTGVSNAWRRLREKAGVVDFRLHDYRHNLATKVLRKTGNLKLVQKMLNHASIRTTTKYAHVLPDEVSAAMESVAQDWRQKPDEKSPTESPTIKRKAS
jgi:integrase